jgi:hypothetical protein
MLYMLQYATDGWCFPSLLRVRPSSQLINSNTSGIYVAYICSSDIMVLDKLTHDGESCLAYYDLGFSLERSTLKHRKFSVQ